MRFINSNIKMISALALIVGSFGACKQTDDFSLNETLTKPDLVFVGLTNTNAVSTAGQLIRYNANNTNQLVGAAVSINPANLQLLESIIAIDYRPATGILYGVSNQSRIYILNPVTGAARVVNLTPFTPAISGGIAGFDFIPTLDRIRLITKSGQNLRLNPEDGTVVATDVNINGGINAVLSEVAYTNNISGSTTTELFDVDFNAGILYKQDANAGTLTQVGLLGVPGINRVVTSTFSAAYNSNILNARPGGFDIAPTGEALVIFNNGSVPAIPVGGIAAGPPVNPASAVNATNGTPTLFQINLATGKATDLGLIPFPAPTNGVAATALIGLAIAPASVAYAVNETNGLMIFNLTKPEPITKPITGLQTGENILGLDFRPLNGQLYALGSSSRIYIINPSSAVATQVGLLPLPFVPTLSGANFGFDFEPTTDLIRITSNLRQNLTFNPTTGVATSNPAITPGGTSSEISALAYSNNLLPSTATTLFGINTRTDSLYRVSSTPLSSSGALTRIGKLRVSADASNGFDIGAVSGIGYAILTTGTTTKIYTINLFLGSATEIATFPVRVRAFTVGLGF